MASVLEPALVERVALHASLDQPLVIHRGPAAPRCSRRSSTSAKALPMKYATSCGPDPTCTVCQSTTVTGRVALLTRRRACCRGGSRRGSRSARGAAGPCNAPTAPTSRWPSRSSRSKRVAVASEEPVPEDQQHGAAGGRTVEPRHVRQGRITPTRRVQLGGLVHHDLGLLDRASRDLVTLLGRREVLEDDHDVRGAVLEVGEVAVGSADVDRCQRGGGRTRPRSRR